MCCIPIRKARAVLFPSSNLCFFRMQAAHSSLPILLLPHSPYNSYPSSSPHLGSNKEGESSAVSYPATSERRLPAAQFPIQLCLNAGCPHSFPHSFVHLQLIVPPCHCFGIKGGLVRGPGRALGSYSEFAGSNPVPRQFFQSHQNSKFKLALFRFSKIKNRAQPSLLLHSEG